MPVKINLKKKVPTKYDEEQNFNLLYLIVVSIVLFVLAIFVVVRKANKDEESMELKLLKIQAPQIKWNTNT